MVLSEPLQIGKFCHKLARFSRRENRRLLCEWVSVLRANDVTASVSTRNPNKGADYLKSPQSCLKLLQKVSVYKEIAWEMFFSPSECHWFVFITAMEQALSIMCVAAQKEPKKVKYSPPPPPSIYLLFQPILGSPPTMPTNPHPSLSPTACPKVFMA